jgi:Coenzyme PQQ synthesis protein D (PqqD)
MSDIFRIDAANIMHESIDGEVVVVNLENGTYYSLDSVGAHVWAQLADGRSVEALVENVAARYEGDRDRIAEGIETFIRRLQEEKLIVTATSEAASPPAPAAPAAPKGVYSDPALQKYTDMEQLLLVDPIHEVDESGWPNVR